MDFLFSRQVGGDQREPPAAHAIYESLGINAERYKTQPDRRVAMRKKLLAALGCIAITGAVLTLAADKASARFGGGPGGGVAGGRGFRGGGFAGEGFRGGVVGGGVFRGAGIAGGGYRGGFAGGGFRNVGIAGRPGWG